MYDISKRNPMQNELMRKRNKIHKNRRQNTLSSGVKIISLRLTKLRNNEMNNAKFSDDHPLVNSVNLTRQYSKNQIRTLLSLSVYLKNVIISTPLDHQVHFELWVSFSILLFFLLLNSIEHKKDAKMSEASASNDDYLCQQDSTIDRSKIEWNNQSNSYGNNYFKFIEFVWKNLVNKKLT